MVKCHLRWCSAGDLSCTLGSGISPGDKNSYTFQYSCLETSIEEPGGLQSMGVGKSWLQLKYTHTKEKFKMLTVK